MTRTIEWLCIPQTIVLIVWSWTVSVSAQIVPDSSLPVESRIVPNGSILSIDGGTTAGTNLFHSFSEFSVPTGTEAAFNNALTIDNIITRVTGGNISKIDGLIRANGSANLFLLNPNGIVFGENAQLAIGGSFFGSTAESLRFADGFEFSSVAPEANPILTVSVPVGLQMGDNPGAIVNRSQATTLNPLPSNSPLPANRGLEVAPGRTLALIGGNIALENGNLTALQGEIQLASFASSGLVTFSVTPTRIALDDSNIDRFGNIDISGASTLNVTGLGSGAIGLHGGEINIRDDANLLAVTLGNIDGRGIEITGDRFRMQDSVLVSTIAFGAGNAGDVTIRTAESVELSGLGFPALQELLFRRVLMGFDLNTLDFGIFTNAQGGGKAGTLSMATGSLTMNEGALIGSSTNGSAPGGDIILQAETMALEEAVVASATLVGSTGNAGDIVIEVGDIKLVDGGYITASSLGSGASGDIIVRADTVEARGLPPGTLTGFSTNSASNRVLSSNRAGNIEIDARRILIADGAFIVSRGGALLQPLEGAALEGGPGGDVTLRASESIEVRGVSSNGLFPAIVGTSSVGDSPAGNTRITTNELRVGNGGVVDVSGGSRLFGTGNAGIIEIEAGSIRLEEAGMLSASTVSGLGGNILVRAGTLQHSRY